MPRVRGSRRSDRRRGRSPERASRRGLRRPRLMAESVAALLRGDTVPRRSRPVAVAAPRPQRSTGWDLLLVCVVVYIASGVGRIYDIFPVLLPLKPALLSTVLAIGLFVLQH